VRSSPVWTAEAGFVNAEYPIWFGARVVGAFPDGQSALNLAAARLRHVAGTEW
jgi:hypothetical protein